MQAIKPFTTLDVATILSLPEPDLEKYIFDLYSTISVAKATPGYIFSTISGEDLDAFTDSQLYTYTVNLSSLVQMEARNISYLNSYSYAASRRAQIAQSTVKGLSTIAYTESIVFANYSTILLQNRAANASSISSATGYQALIDASAGYINTLSTTLGNLNSTISGESLINTGLYQDKLRAFQIADLSASKADALAAHTSTVLGNSFIRSSITGLQYEQVTAADKQALIDISNNRSTILGYTTLISDLSSAIQSTIVADTTLQLQSITARADLSQAIAYSTVSSLSATLLTLQSGGGASTDPAVISTIQGLKDAIAAIGLNTLEAASLAAANAEESEYRVKYAAYISQKASSFSTSVGYSAVASTFLSSITTLTSSSVAYGAIAAAYDISAQEILLEVQRLSVTAALASSIMISSISTLTGVDKVSRESIAAKDARVKRSQMFSATDIAKAQADYDAAVAASEKAAREDLTQSLIISQEQAGLQTAYYTLAFNSVEKAQASIDLSIAKQIRYQGEYGYKEYLLRQTRVALTDKKASTDVISPYITACENFDTVASTILRLYQSTSTVLVSRAPISISGDIVQGQIKVLSTTMGLRQQLLQAYTTSNISLGPQITSSLDAANRASTILAENLADNADITPLFYANRSAQLAYLSNTTKFNNNAIQIRNLTNIIRESRASTTDLQLIYSNMTVDLPAIDATLGRISSAILREQLVASTFMSTIDKGVSTQLSFSDMQELLSTLGYATSGLPMASGAVTPLASGAVTLIASGALSSSGRPIIAAPSGLAASVSAASGAAASVSAASGPAASVSAASGPAASGPAASGLAASGPAASGPAASGAAPSGPAASVPPRSSGAAPSLAAPSGAAPSGLAPSGPALSAAAPSGALPSGPASSVAAPSGLVPSGLAPSGLAPPLPSGPASGTRPAAPASSGPAPGSLPLTAPSGARPAAQVTPTPVVSGKMPTVNTGIPLGSIPSFTAQGYVPFIPPG